MNILPTRNGGPSLSGDPSRYGISNTSTNNTTNSIHGHSNRNIWNVSNSNNNTVNAGVSEEFIRIQAWLSPLEPDRRHQDVSNRRLGGVGDWVLQRNEYESWRKSRDGSGSPALLCYGGQGVGKTHISSLVIDTLCEQAHGQNIAVLSFYCDYQAEKDKSAVNIIGSLLKQVAMGATGIPSEIQSAFEGWGQRGGKGLRLPDMLKLFFDVITSIERVYICVDAVDELPPQDRPEFLRALRQIIREASNTRLFLTGRPYIRGELDRHLTGGIYTIRILADQGDVARYLSQKTDDDRDPDLMTENLRNKIMKAVLEKASEMFLLVALNIDAILGEASLASREEMLQKVAATSVGLDNMYDQALQRIREQKDGRSRLGIEVLMWVFHAKRPLRIDELCHALAVDAGTTDIDPENIQPQDTVLGSCLGLAVIDEETSTVRLTHYTLHEYLSRPGILPDANKTLAQSCLAYLNSEKVKGLPANKFPNLGEMPFLEYSSLYWGSHAKMDLSGRAKTLALELNRYDNHISSTLLFNHIHGCHFHPLADHLFTSLHCASYFGISEAVTTLIEMKGCNINQGDCMGFTPLNYASGNGHEGVVRLLLTRDDVNTDHPNNDGETPLLRASRNGHEGVVRLLLARDDINSDKPGSDDETPLYWASRNGYQGVVKLLLARHDVNPDKPDNDDATPLYWASRNGHGRVVKLLLARHDVNPDKPCNDGKTPLWCASRNGHEGVVRLLLARDAVNPDTPDDVGETSLYWASRNGYEGVVKLLLARHDVNPDKPDNDGKTPLWCASKKGREGVVKLLLARHDVNPDKPGNNDETPLYWASKNGHKGVVELLLARHDVNPDKPDNDGETPLLCASRNGHEGVVRLLLARDVINPDTPDNSGQTPLYWASRNGHEGVVKLLLARHDVNPDKPAYSGEIPPVFPTGWAADRRSMKAAPA